VNLADSVGVDFDELIREFDFDKVDVDDTVSQLVKKVAEPIAVKIMTAVFLIVLAIIFILLLKIVVMIICKVTKLPVIGGADKILGGLLGAIKAFVFVGLISILLSALFGNSTSVLGDMVEDSFVIGLYDLF
jgi:uncharacterized membrane protein required for colicin V production